MFVKIKVKEVDKYLMTTITKNFFFYFAYGALLTMISFQKYVCISFKEIRNSQVHLNPCLKLSSTY